MAARRRDAPYSDVAIFPAGCDKLGFRVPGDDRGIGLPLNSAFLQTDALFEVERNTTVVCYDGTDGFYETPGHRRDLRFARQRTGEIEKERHRIRRVDGCAVGDREEKIDTRYRLTLPRDGMN